MADVKVDSAIDASVIARGCPGMSGADLQNLVNQVSPSYSFLAEADDRLLLRLPETDHQMSS
jgi:hypothetical protein